MNTTHLQCAEQYCLLGWRLVPVHGLTDGTCSCGSANCGRAGKHPRVVGWTTKASADARQVAAWWTTWPQANVGLATGADSGVVVLDIDGETGRATLGELAGQDPSVLDTHIHRTGGGGSHLFYEHPGFKCGNSVRTMPGIDIRGDGGLIVLPPSLHKSGFRYQVMTDRSAAPLPDSLKPLFYECHKEEQRDTRRVEEKQRKGREG